MANANLSAAKKDEFYAWILAAKNVTCAEIGDVAFAISAFFAAKTCSTLNCDIVGYVPEPPASPRGRKRGREDAP